MKPNFKLLLAFDFKWRKICLLNFMELLLSVLAKIKCKLNGKYLKYLYLFYNSLFIMELSLIVILFALLYRSIGLNI